MVPSIGRIIFDAVMGVIVVMAVILGIMCMLLACMGVGRELLTWT